MPREKTKYKLRCCELACGNVVQGQWSEQCKNYEHKLNKLNMQSADAVIVHFIVVPVAYNNWFVHLLS